MRAFRSRERLSAASSGSTVGVDPLLVRAPNPGVMTLEGTNTWVIPASVGTVVIDPGPAEPLHLAAVGCHGRIAAVVLTHRHLDHSAAITLLAPRIPVYAASRALIRGTEPIGEGDTIVLGDVRLRVIALAGHTADSIGLVYARAPSGPVLFTGDALLGGRTAPLIVARDGGDLGEHLWTLDRLAALAGVRGLPGHGPVIADVAEHAQRAREHRRSRLALLRARLAADPQLDLSALARERHPAAPEKQAAARRMLEIELAHLRRR